MKLGLINSRLEVGSRRDLQFRVLPSVLDVWEFLADPLDSSDWFVAEIDERASDEDRVGPAASRTPRVVVLEPNRRIRIEMASPSATRSLTVALTPGGSQGTLVQIEADGWRPEQRRGADRALRLVAQALEHRFGERVGG